MTRNPATDGAASGRTRSLRARRVTGIAAAVAAAALLLSACSSAGEPAPSGSAGASADFGDASIQLSWLKNTQFAGEYVAEEDGFFTDAGFKTVTLTAGGSSATSAEAAVTTGQAFIGISAPLITGPAINSGATVKIVGSLYQRNPFALVSAADKPIKTAEDVVGKKIAVSDSNTLVWNAFLEANKINAADVTTVPFSDTSMLTTGQVDGYIGYTTSGASALTQAGFDATEFLLADEGLPMLGEVLVVSQDSIDNHRDKVEAMLEAIVRGWKGALADPERAVDLTVNTYGKDQEYDVDAMTLAFERQATLIESDETAKNGILTVSDELQKATVASLKLAGVTISAEDLFDLGPLNDMYTANPELR